METQSNVDFECIRTHLSRLRALASFVNEYAFNCSEGKSSEYAFAKSVYSNLISSVSEISKCLKYVEQYKDNCE